MKINNNNNTMTNTFFNDLALQLFLGALKTDLLSLFLLLLLLLFFLIILFLLLFFF